MRTLLDNVDILRFSYYDSQNVKTINIIDIKKLEVAMLLKDSLLSKEYNWDYKSARFVLRNCIPGGSS